MKRKLIGLTVVLVLFSFSGCGLVPQLAELTDEQEKLVTEYAAGLLLKYDKTYDNGLLTEEELLVAEQKEIEQLEKEKKQKQLAEEYLEKTEKAKADKEKQKEEKKDKEDTESATVSTGPAVIASDAVGEFMALDGVGISYLGMKNLKSFPENGNSAFSIDASNGNELIVTRFKVKNNTETSKEVDLFDKGIVYTLVCADGSSYTSSTTWLAEDLSIYKNTLNGSAGDETVLIFEIPEGKDLTGASIKIVTGNEIGTLSL